MIILLMILAALAAFLFGFLVAAVKEPMDKTEMIAARKQDKQIEELLVEYKNFLNYDGSEQA